MNWERKRAKLCKTKGVSISARRGGWRVYLGKSITRKDRVYEKQHSELRDAISDVEDWLEVKNQATNAARILSDAQMEDALASYKLLQTHDVDLSLLEVARIYVSKLPKGARKTHSELINTYIDDAERKGRSEKHIVGMRYMLKKFSALYGDEFLTDIDQDDIEEWLNVTCLGKAAKTYNNHLVTIKALYNFALKRDWILDNPAQRLEKLKVVPSEPCIFSVEDLKSVLNFCIEQSLWEELLCFGIQAFAGLRRSEVLSLQWNAIGSESIRVTGKSSKVNKGRGVPILPPLKSILTLYKKRVPAHYGEGLVSKLLPHEWDKSKARIRQALNIDWGHNQLRHSFVSHRLAATKDISSTSYESGHSPAIMLTNYDAVVSHSIGLLYFSI